MGAAAPYKPLSHKLFGAPWTTHRRVVVDAGLALGITTIFAAITAPIWVLYGIVNPLETKHAEDMGKAAQKLPEKAEDDRLKQDIAAIDAKISALEQEAQSTPDDQQAALERQQKIDALQEDRQALTQKREDLWSGMVSSLGGDPKMIFVYKDRVNYRLTVGFPVVLD